MDKVQAKLTAVADQVELVDWSASVDSTIARAHQHATNKRRLTGGGGSNYPNLRDEPPDHAVGRSRGGLSTKIYQLAGGNGLPLVTLLTAGQTGDSPMLLPLMTHLRVACAFDRPRTRPDAVRGDKAYSSRTIRGHLRSRGIKAVIPEPADQKGHHKHRGSRGAGPLASMLPTTRTVMSSNDVSVT